MLSSLRMQPEQAALALNYNNYIEPPNDNVLPTVSYNRGQKLWRGLCGFLLFPWSLMRSHLINSDELGLVLEDGKPQILEPGWHILFSPFRSLQKKVKISDPYIEVGSLKIINVKMGEYAYISDTLTGQRKLLAPGRHIINSPSRVFNRFINLNNPELGLTEEQKNEFQIIRVETGNVGIINRKGVLAELEPGLHVVSSPDRYQKTVSKQLQILELPEEQYIGKDHVALNVKAAVTYSIIDPIKVRATIKDFAQYLLDISKTTLAGIIRSLTLKQLGQDTSPQKITDSSNAYQNIQKIFMGELESYEMEKSLGLRIHNIRVVSMKIADEALTQSLAASATLPLKAQAQQANLVTDSNIKLREAEMAASIVLVKAEADKKAAILRAEGEAQAMTLKAEAQNRINAMTADVTMGERNQQVKLAMIAASALSQTTQVYLPAEPMSHLLSLSLFKNEIMPKVVNSPAKLAM